MQVTSTQAVDFDKLPSECSCKHIATKQQSNKDTMMLYCGCSKGQLQLVCIPKFPPKQVSLRGFFFPPFCSGSGLVLGFFVTFGLLFALLLGLLFALPFVFPLPFPFSVVFFIGLPFLHLHLLFLLPLYLLLYSLCHPCHWPSSWEPWLVKLVEFAKPKSKVDIFMEKADFILK